MGLRHQYQESILRHEWAEKSQEIKVRDNYTCQKCQSNNNILHVHHKYYVQGRQPWEYPDCGLTTLCNYCHTEEHLNIIPNYYEGQLELLKIEQPELHLRQIAKQEQSERERKIKAKEEQEKNEQKKQDRKELLQSLGLLLLFPIWYPIGMFILYGIPVILGVLGGQVVYSRLGPSLLSSLISFSVGISLTWQIYVLIKERLNKH